MVAIAEIRKKRWLLWLKFLKKVVAMAEIPAEVHFGEGFFKMTKLHMFNTFSMRRNLTFLAFFINARIKFLFS